MHAIHELYVRCKQKHFYSAPYTSCISLFLSLSLAHEMSIAFDAAADVCCNCSISEVVSLALYFHSIEKVRTGELVPVFALKFLLLLPVAFTRVLTFG